MKEPDAAAFISAMVAGTNARLIVIACADTVEATVFALTAAARQTGGKVVCITEGHQLSKTAAEVEHVAGNAEHLISSMYTEADCIIVDCTISNSQRILKTAKTSAGNAILLGYNAWKCGGFDPHLLPLGGGLLVDRAAGRKSIKRPRWVVRIDKFTGEEHIFRLRG